MNTRTQARPQPPTIDPDMLRDAFAAPALRDALQRLYLVVSQGHTHDEIEEALLWAERALAMARG